MDATNASQISLNGNHGRVFFVLFGLDTLQSRRATAESVVGIVIEGVSVARVWWSYHQRRPVGALYNDWGTCLFTFPAATPSTECSPSE